MGATSHRDVPSVLIISTSKHLFLKTWRPRKSETARKKVRTKSSATSCNAQQPFAKKETICVNVNLLSFNTLNCCHILTKEKKKPNQIHFWTKGNFRFKLANLSKAMFFLPWQILALNLAEKLDQTLNHRKIPPARHQFLEAKVQKKTSKKKPTWPK